MLVTFWKAMVLGLSVAAPVGPIGILCIRRTLADGRWVGFACGLGAATADGIYGLLAGLGLTVLSASLGSGNLLLRIVGTAYLAFLGARAFRATPADSEAAAKAEGSWRAWGSTFLLTITNPMTIMSFAAMFSAIALGREERVLWLRAPVLASGVFLGSAAWWLFLSSGVSLLRARVRPRHLTWINRTAGVLLLGFAAASLLELVGRAQA